MGRWLEALKRAEKIAQGPQRRTDKTDNTGCEGVSSVLSVPHQAGFEKFEDRRNRQGRFCRFCQCVESRPVRKLTPSAGRNIRGECQRRN